MFGRRGQSQVRDQGTGAGIVGGLDPAGRMRGQQQALLQVTQRQQSLSQRRQSVGRTHQKQRRCRDDAQTRGLTGIGAKVGKVPGGQRLSIEGDGLHGQAQALGQTRQHRRLRRAVRTVGAIEEPDPDVGSECAQLRLTLLTGHAVEQIGVGADRTPRGLVEIGIALHHLLKGLGETRGLVERELLQIEIERDLGGGRVVDGLEPIVFEVGAQPGRREWGRVRRCGRGGRGRLRCGRRGRGRGRRLGVSRGGRYRIALIPKPALGLAIVEARTLPGLRRDRRQRQGEQRRRQVSGLWFRHRSGRSWCGTCRHPGASGSPGAVRGRRPPAPRAD